MIKITINKKDSNIVSFSVKGHAEFAEHGKDIVCAGVSTVVIGTVNAIERICGVRADHHTTMNDGFLQYYLPSLSGDAYRNAQVLLLGMVVSLETVQSEYSKFVKIHTIK